MRWTLSLCAVGALELASHTVSFHALIDQIIQLDRAAGRIETVLRPGESLCDQRRL